MVNKNCHHSHNNRTKTISIEWQALCSFFDADMPVCHAARALLDCFKPGSPLHRFIAGPSSRVGIALKARLGLDRTGTVTSRASRTGKRCAIPPAVVLWSNVYLFWLMCLLVQNGSCDRQKSGKEWLLKSSRRNPLIQKPP